MVYEQLKRGFIENCKYNNDFRGAITGAVLGLVMGIYNWDELSIQNLLLYGNQAQIPLVKGTNVLEHGGTNALENYASAELAGGGKTPEIPDEL